MRHTVENIGMNKLALGLAAVAMTFAGAAVAQDAAKDKAAVTIPAGVFYKGQQSNQILARDHLLGAKVVNAQGQIIGDIEDFILNDQNQVEGVIMGTGGFLGRAEKKLGVRLSALKISEKGGKTVVTLPEATKDVLRTIEPYKRAKAPKSLMDRAMEKAQEMYDKSSETSKDAYQTAKEQAGPTLQKAKDAAGQALEKGKEAAGQAMEKGKQAVDAAKDAAKPTPAPKQ